MLNIEQLKAEQNSHSMQFKNNFIQTIYNSLIPLKNEQDIHFLIILKVSEFYLSKT